jgi:hypothetical protein
MRADPVAKLSLALAAAAAALLMASRSSAEPRVLPVDGETTAGGVPVACTGIGQTRLDPKWAAYGVRVEVSNAANEYLVDAAITVRDRKGAEVLSVSCDAPWILMKLPPGAYRIEGRILNSAAKPRSATFSPPASGQMRLVLQFPDA